LHVHGAFRAIGRRARASRRRPDRTNLVQRKVGEGGQLRARTRPIARDVRCNWRLGPTARHVRCNRPAADGCARTAPRTCRERRFRAAGDIAPADTAVPQDAERAPRGGARCSFVRCRRLYPAGRSSRSSSSRVAANSVLSILP
jgi:hypothetical protein